MLSDFLSKLTWDRALDIHGKLREVCKNVATYRSHNGWSFADAAVGLPAPDLKWRAGFPKSADATLKFIDHYVFGTQQDSNIRAAVRSRKDVPNFLDTDPMSVELELIKKLNQEENSGTSGETGDSTTPQKGGRGWGDDGEDGAEEDVSGLAVVARLCPEVKAAAAVATDDQLEKLTYYRQKASIRVSANITLICEDTLDSEFVKQLKASPVSKMRADPESRKFVGLFYDYKLAAQSNSSPHLRIAGMRSNGDHLKKWIMNVLAALDPTQIGPNDFFFCSTGRRRGTRAPCTRASLRPVARRWRTPPGAST